MGNNEIIKPHSFEEAKHHIQTFSSKTSSDLGLSRVDSSGGLFGLGKHKVTGDELNKITGQIQDYLIKFNGLHSDFITEFGQVYKALESLDSEYIPAILSAVKGAERASEQAKAAHDDIKKSIEAEKKIVKVLEEHKEKLDKLKHLTNIDEIWNTSKTLEKDMVSFKNKSEELKQQFSKLDVSLKSLQKFANDILDYEHLEDVDEMWEKVNSFEEKLPDITTRIEDLSASIDSNIRSIENIESKLTSLDEYEHLSEIDKIWGDVQLHKEEISELGDCIDSNKKDIESLKAETASLNAFRKNLEKQEHLGQVDEIWRKTETTESAVNGLAEKVNQDENSIKTLEKDLGEIQDKTAKNSTNIYDIQKTVSEHKNKLDQYDQLEHLLEIDAVWNRANSNTDQIESLIKDIKEEATLITGLQGQLADEKKAHIDDLQLLNKKIKNAYYLAGGVGALLIVEFILHFMRIL